MTFKEELLAILKINITQEQEDQFFEYYNFLVESNKEVNLTAITEINEVYYKHFFDSLTVTKTIDLKKIETLCDMGAGAGFPSIPLKIIFPHLKITIIDSLGKRIKFLNALIERLGLNDVELIYDRIENVAKDRLHFFDLVTARALGELSIISELGIPMVKKGKFFLAMKGKRFLEEIAEAEKTIRITGGEIKLVNTLELPFDYGMRAHVLVQKTKEVNGFPRAFSVIKRKPIK